MFTARSTIATFALGALLLPAAPAKAHQTSMKAHVTGPGDPAALVVLDPSSSRASWSFGSTKGGEIRLKVKKAEDTSGDTITLSGNKMVMDFEFDGVAQPTQTVLFDLNNGKANVKVPSQGLASGANVKIVRVELTDPNDVVFGRLGFVMRNK